MIKFEDLGYKEIEYTCTKHRDDIQGYLSYAETKDGRELTQAELDHINDLQETMDYISECWWLEH